MNRRRYGSSGTTRRKATTRSKLAIGAAIGALLLLFSLTAPAIATAATGTDGAGVAIGNQTVANGTVTVDRVTVPDGGYVVVHSGRYVFDGRPDPIGNSSYLEPGTHRDVEVRLRPRAIRPGATGRVAAVVHRDSAGDEALTRYVNGSDADPPYRADGEPIEDTASVSAPATPAPTEARATPPETATAPSPTSSTPAGSRGDGDGGSGDGLLVIAGVVVGGVVVAGAIMAGAAAIARRGRP